MALPSPSQRTFLLGFVASIAICGVIGIYCLLMGRMNDLAARVLATTGTVGAASILSLASAIPWERRRWHPVGPAGLVAVAIATTLLLYMIWSGPLSHDTAFEKITVVACAWAIAIPHTGLLALARLHRGYEWVRVATLGAVGTLAVLVSVAVAFEIDEDAMFRAVGVTAIADVCGTIAVPILHRVSAIRRDEGVRTTALELDLTCPRCAKTQRVPTGRSRCAVCGLGLLIEIEEEHCERCGYVLYAIRSSNCPECGAPIRRAAAPGA